MSEKMDTLIKEIAIKHGMVLSKDDPVLMLQTVNEQLIEDNKKAHQEILLNFKGEIEHISTQWRDDAKDKSEKILNAALASSKEMMTKLVQQSTNQAVEAIQTIMNRTIIELKGVELRTKNYSRTSLLASGVIIVSLLIVSVFSFFSVA